MPEVTVTFSPDPNVPFTGIVPTQSGRKCSVSPKRWRAGDWQPRSVSGATCEPSLWLRGLRADVPSHLWDAGLMSSDFEHGRREPGLGPRSPHRHGHRNQAPEESPHHPDGTCASPPRRHLSRAPGPRRAGIPSESASVAAQVRLERGPQFWKLRVLQSPGG